MLDDTYIKSYMTINQSTGQMYDNGALIPMFGFEFYEVMNCPDRYVWTDAGTGKKRIRVYRKWDTAKTYVLNGHTYVAGDADAAGFIYGYVEEAGGTYAVTDGYVNDKRTGNPASYIPGQVTWTIPADWKELKVQHTIILGKDALMRTGLSGEDNAKTYVKPLGSSGVLDPIDQRQSIGFKINSVGFGSTRLEAVVDYLNIPSQLNA
jgi:hypothetical protein